MRRGWIFFAMMALAWAPARANTIAVVATQPAEGSTSVALQTSISFTFNKAIDPSEVAELFVAAPEDAIQFGDFTVSEDGHLVTVSVTHAPGTDYVWIVSGTYQDLNDETLSGIEPHVLRYTTTNGHGDGRLAGTVRVSDAIELRELDRRHPPVRYQLPAEAPVYKEMQHARKERVKDGSPSTGQGMPTSQFANPDLTGTVVILSSMNPFTSEEEESLAGAAVVNGSSGQFSVPYLRAGEYFPYALKVGVVDPDAPMGELLDATYFGFYDPNGDGEPDAITIQPGGTTTGIDFSIAPLSFYSGTAAEMEATAREAADVYASDQMLVGASTWAMSATGNSAAWTYNYYSHSTGMKTDVTVTPFDVEVVPTEYAGENPPAALPIPHVDSDQAMAVGLVNGGEAFLQDFPLAIIGMSAGIALDADPGSGLNGEGPYWAVAYMNLSPTRIDYLVVYVDFLTGEFLGSERAAPAAGKYSDRFQEALTEVSGVDGSFMLVGVHGDGVTTEGVAEEWQFEFYAEDIDTRAIVAIREGGSTVDTEIPAGNRVLMPLGGIIIDSDVAVSAAMDHGGAAFADEHGLARIVVDAGDLSGLFPAMADTPAYLVTIYGGNAPGDLWFRAVLDPTTARLLHSEESGRSASDPETEVPIAIELGANFPNPFNPQTTIPFRLAAASNAKLTVHDLLGREVAVLVNGAMPPGAHDVSWDASDAPSGVYFYRLTAAGSTQTSKMVLQR